MTARKRIFLLLFALIQISLIWPVYPLMSDIYPLILGLPLSFAWVILMLIASFLTLLWYYLTDPGADPHPNREPPESQMS